MSLTLTSSTSDEVAESIPTSDSATPSSRRWPKIDIHTHILPENLPDLAKRYGYGDWIRLEHSSPCCARMYQGSKFFREIEANCFRSDPRIEDCNSAGVTVQCLSTVPVMFSYWARGEDALDLSILLNDHIAEICKKNPRRFVGLGTVPLQSPDLAIAEMQRCMAIGLRGVQIGSHVNDMALSDPSLFPFFEACAAADACILVHPWDMVGSQLMNKYWLPWLVGMPAETSFAICSLIFGGVLERLPNLRVCFCHAGGSFIGTIGRIEHGFHCRQDLVAVDNKRNPREYLGKFWVDSLTHDASTLKQVVDAVGQDRCILGSDYPFPLGESIPGKMIEETELIDDESKQKILWDNAIEFLGLAKRADQLLPFSLAPDDNGFTQ